MVHSSGVPALLVLSAERSRTALLRVLPLLHSSSDELYCFAEALLDLVFYAGQHQRRGRSFSRNRQTNRHVIEFYGGKQVQSERSPAMLTAAQHEVLMAIVAHDPLWEWECNLLALYGVPAERAALQAWLAD